MRARLFWRLGLTYLVLLAGVLIAVDSYSARVVRSHSIRSANDQLVSLLNLAQARPPDVSSEPELRAWTEWMARSGARVTIIDASGRVLADSASSTDAADHLKDWPEVQEALADGAGHSVDSARELVCRAQRFQPASGSLIVIRLALPLTQIGLSLKELRQRRLVASLIIFVIGIAVSLIFARVFSARVEQLKDFSQQIARGDFRPWLAEGPRDELSDLADSMNQTAAQLDRRFAR